MGDMAGEGDVRRDPELAREALETDAAVPVAIDGQPIAVSGAGGESAQQQVVVLLWHESAEGNETAPAGATVARPPVAQAVDLAEGQRGVGNDRNRGRRVEAGDVVAHGRVHHHPAVDGAGL